MGSENTKEFSQTKLKLTHITHFFFTLNKQLINVATYPLFVVLTSQHPHLHPVNLYQQTSDYETPNIHADEPA